MSKLKYEHECKRERKVIVEIYGRPNSNGDSMMRAYWFDVGFHEGASMRGQAYLSNKEKMRKVFKAVDEAGKLIFKEGV